MEIKSLRSILEELNPKSNIWVLKVYREEQRLMLEKEKPTNGEIYGSLITGHTIGSKFRLD